MTGSPSKSCTGKKYFYYHCNHCKKERFSAKKVNTIFESILDDFQFTKQSKLLYREILKSLSGTNQKDSFRKRKKLEIELASSNQRIENLQDLLVDGTISPKVYGQTLNRYTQQTEQITSNLKNLNTTNSEYKGLIENAFNHLENFRQTYANTAIEHKKKLISSIFPEKIEFDGKKCRTTRINDVLRYILQVDRDLPQNKMGQISKNISLSRLVETPRIELGSKQAAKKLSTYIVLS
jgi:site-specific DNA recombinase